MRLLLAIVLGISALGHIQAADEPFEVILEIHEVYTKQIDATQTDENVIVTLPEVVKYVACSSSYIVHGRKYDQGNSVYWGAEHFDLAGKLYTLPSKGRSVGIAKIDAPGDVKGKRMHLSFDIGYFQGFYVENSTFEKVVGFKVIDGLSTAVFDEEKRTITVRKKIHVLLKLKEEMRVRFEEYLKTIE